MALEFPPIYLLKSHFERDPNELHQLEKEIGVVWNIKEAKLVLGRVKSTTRAAHELRKLGLHTEEVQKPDEGAGQSELRPSPSKKRRKIERVSVDGKEVIALDSDTGSEPGTDISNDEQRKRTASASLSNSSATSSPLVQKLASSSVLGSEETVKVLNLAWYTDSIKAGKLLPIDKYLVYEGAIPSTPKSLPVKPKPTILPASIASRRKAGSPSSKRHSRHASRKFGSPSSHSNSQRAQLLHQTTSEYEESLRAPPIPEYLHTPYSCQRPTPLHCPNEDFLSQLRLIKKGRNLKGDEIGVR
jgi:DNA polymerase IV